MEKIVSEFSTEIRMTSQEAREICRLGQGEGCCAYLVAAPTGLECSRMSYPISAHIMDRLKSGSMVAKGTGGWTGCPWEGKL